MGLQPSRTVLTTLVGDHPRIIPVKFDQTPEKLKLYLSENVNKRQMMNEDWSQQLSLNMVCSGNLAKIKNMQWFKKLSIKLVNIHHTLLQRKAIKNYYYEIKIVPMFMMMLPFNSFTVITIIAVNLLWLSQPSLFKTVLLSKHYQRRKVLQAIPAVKDDNSK